MPFCICARNWATRCGAKKKLAKLLYFVDFDLYEKRRRPLTGDVYKAFPMGPFPSKLEEITNEMAKEKLLSIDSIEGYGGYNATEVYHCLRKPDTSVFEEERRMLDHVATKYGHLNSKQLEDLSHYEAPYIGTELRKEIPYELAFYRGTDFSDL
ncbi:MAG: Panacea domain-containing protein [Patescibacteria group bacterium]|nr:Panacea domain-containing protein [Patescibacteria group bacterium]